MGSSYGLKLLLNYIEKLKRKSSEFYILKLDISKYFYSIDHEVLKSLLKDKLTKEEYYFLDIIISSTDEDYVNNKINYLKNKEIEFKTLFSCINNYANCFKYDKIKASRILDKYIG